MLDISFGSARSFCRHTLRSGLALYYALFIVLALLFLFGAPPERTILWDAVFDVGHAPLFGLVLWLALTVIDRMYPAPSTAKANRFYAVVLTLGLAAVSEAVQFFQPSRSPSFGDLLRDAAGIFAVLLLRVATPAASIGPHWWRRPTTLRALALGLALAVLTPLALVIDAYNERDRAFPTIIRFDGARWERQFLSVGGTGGAKLTPAAGPSAPGRDALALLALQPGGAPGLSIREPYPDWTGHNELVFAVFTSTEVTETLTVRIYDAKYNGRVEDSFRKDIRLDGGRRVIRIPLSDVRTTLRGRELDLENIRYMSLFVWKPTRQLDLHLGPLRLE